ncbi:hypothetical protein [Saccharothrix xinjiangensis]|uniref:Uncharacterized protein n=1 Tax=Saccharothrix xinjiangensis TaxID=204798 RepID=A0ABV9Y936_9PSEU
MNDIDAQRPSHRTRQEPRGTEEPPKPAAPRQLTGLEWLVRQAQRRRPER